MSVAVGGADLLAVVAHELRAPITVVMGLIDGLARAGRNRTDEDVDECLARIHRQSERLYRLVGDLLDLSQIESGELRVSPQPLRLAGAVSRALEYAPPPNGKSVKVALDDNSWVVADPGRLDQVLINLLSNAYKYGGPNIRIETRGATEGVQVAISDDGEGVPAKLVPDLFQRFTRGINATSVHGSGLGLAIAAALVETLGGRIWYEANQPTGARFTFLLMPAEEGGANASVTGSTKGPNGRLAEILIVDDEEDMRFLLRMALEDAGHEVVEAPHGAAAVERVARSRPGLVITDLMMPVMTGHELVERLRSDPQTRDIPILVISARPQPVTPADAILAKPFRIHELLEVVAGLLTRTG